MGHAMPQPSRPGFSTVELLVAISILTIMAAVSLPYFTSALAMRRLSSATLRVADDLRLAQAKAVSQGVLHRFISGNKPGVSQSGTYRLERSTDNGTTWSAVTNWYRLNTDYSGTAIQSIQDATPNTIYEVWFNAQGNAANSPVVSYPILLTVSGTSGTKEIRVFSTGTVRAPQ
jgi:Tfp pilus assembly protein FimT